MTWKWRKLNAMNFACSPNAARSPKSKIWNSQLPPPLQSPTLMLLYASMLTANVRCRISVMCSALSLPLAEWCLNVQAWRRYIERKMILTNSLKAPNNRTIQTHSNLSLISIFKILLFLVFVLTLYFGDGPTLLFRFQIIIIPQSATHVGK